MIMQILPNAPQINPANLPLDRLAENANIPVAEKLGELSRQFEAVLLRQILKEAQKPVFPSSIHPQTAVSDIYKDMTSAHLAEAISRSGELGLASSLAAQLGSQFKVNSAHEPGG
jgi:Rod binding domain-containing protein